MTGPTRRIAFFGSSLVSAYWNGATNPPDIAWPDNVRRVDHLPPREHRRFYNAQRFTLNVSRADMVHSGWSPSVRRLEIGLGSVSLVALGDGGPRVLGVNDTGGPPPGAAAWSATGATGRTPP